LDFEKTLKVRENNCYYSGAFLKTVKTVYFSDILSLTPQLIAGLIKKHTYFSNRFNGFIISVE